MPSKSLCLFLLALITAQAGAAPFPDSYVSGGRRIAIDCYSPPAGQKRPAIIILYGSGGIISPGFELRARARELSAQGYAVFLPHYFNRTGHLFVRPSGVPGNLPAWTETVDDAVSYVARQPEVDAKRIALFGYSLGGYLSLGVAAQDRRVAAVLEVSGALDREHVAHLPPTLILHGAQDQTVPVTKAAHVEKLLQEAGAPFQRHIYPSEGHNFSPAALRDASGRIQRFLARYLPLKRTATAGQRRGIAA